MAKCRFPTRNGSFRKASFWGRFSNRLLHWARTTDNLLVKLYATTSDTLDLIGAKSTKCLPGPTVVELTNIWKNKFFGNEVTSNGSTSWDGEVMPTGTNNYTPQVQVGGGSWRTLTIKPGGVQWSSITEVLSIRSNPLCTGTCTTNRYYIKVKERLIISGDTVYRVIELGVDDATTTALSLEDVCITEGCTAQQEEDDENRRDLETLLSGLAKKGAIKHYPPSPSVFLNLDPYTGPTPTSDTLILTQHLKTTMI